MDVVVLAGGVGAGKFLRGLVRAIPPERVTVIVNTGDDLILHGLHVSPDVDSVLYWLADVADRDRGWGRRGESFRALEEVRRLGGEAWFALGDLDLAVHLVRTERLRSGETLSEATGHLARALGVTVRVLPMSDHTVTTRIEVLDGSGRSLDLDFQRYWVARGARDEVKGIRYAGAEAAAAAPGVVEALLRADAVIIAPSNPVASIAPILSVSQIAEAVERRRDRVVGVTPIVAGAPLRGMADRLMPAAGLEVSGRGAAMAYGGRLGSWVMDERDADLGTTIEQELGVRVRAIDTIMRDDADAERVARAALEVALGG